jgi:hypothetical protein
MTEVVPPTAEWPRVPERDGSLWAQVDALGRGKRVAVILPPSQEVYIDKLPPGLRAVAITTATGAPQGTAIYDPSLTTPETIQELAATSRSNELTGMPCPEGPETTIAAVARATVDGARVEKGTELWASYIAPGYEDKFREEATTQFAEYQPVVEFGGGELEQQVLEERESLTLRALDPVDDLQHYRDAYEWRGHKKPSRARPDMISFEDFNARDPSQIVMGLFNGQLCAVYLIIEIAPGIFDTHFTSKRGVSRNYVLAGARFLLSWLLENGAIEVLAFVSPYNKPLCQFVEAIGYEPTEVIHLPCNETAQSDTLPSGPRCLTKYVAKKVSL